MSLTPYTQQILNTIIEEQEGGWRLTNNKDDPGGATFAGVTANMFKKHGYTLPISLAGQTMQTIVYAIYEQEFVKPLRLDELPEQIRGPLLSCAINVGTEQAVKILQSCWTMHIQCDGICGPETIVNTNKALLIYGAKEYLEMFLREWMRFYINLVQNNAEAWREFALGQHIQHPKVLYATQLEGWFDRVEFWR